MLLPWGMMCAFDGKDSNDCENPFVHMCNGRVISIVGVDTSGRSRLLKWFYKLLEAEVEKKVNHLKAWQVGAAQDNGDLEWV